MNHPAKSPYLWRANFPYAMTKKGDSVVKQKSSQIARQVCIPNFANELNQKWHAKLNGTIWENYQLIGGQWLKAPLAPYSQGLRDVFPEKLANVSLEPFPHLVSKEYKADGFSCIGCHTLAPIQKGFEINSDISFLISEAK